MIVVDFILSSTWCIMWYVLDTDDGGVCVCACLRALA